MRKDHVLLLSFFPLSTRNATRIQSEPFLQWQSNISVDKTRSSIWKADLEKDFFLFWGRIFFSLLNELTSFMIGLEEKTLFQVFCDRSQSDCQENEVFVTCGACEGVCANPRVSRLQLSLKFLQNQICFTCLLLSVFYNKYQYFPQTVDILGFEDCYHTLLSLSIRCASSSFNFHQSLKAVQFYRSFSFFSENLHEQNFFLFR